MQTDRRIERDMEKKAEIVRQTYTDKYRQTEIDRLIRWTETMDRDR